MLKLYLLPEYRHVSTGLIEYFLNIIMFVLTVLTNDIYYISQLMDSFQTRTRMFNVESSLLSSGFSGEAHLTVHFVVSIALRSEILHNTS